jgi:hypothetical protein
MKTCGCSRVAERGRTPILCAASRRIFGSTTSYGRIGSAITQCRCSIWLRVLAGVATARCIAELQALYERIVWVDTAGEPQAFSGEVRSMQ